MLHSMFVCFQDGSGPQCGPGSWGRVYKVPSPALSSALSREHKNTKSLLFFPAPCTVKVPQVCPGRDSSSACPLCQRLLTCSPALQPALLCSKTSREFRSRKRIAFKEFGRREFPRRWGAGRFVPGSQEAVGPSQVNLCGLHPTTSAFPSL